MISQADFLAVQVRAVTFKWLINKMKLAKERLKVFPLQASDGCLKLAKERLSVLALMNIHDEKPVYNNAVVQIFVEKYPPRMLLDDLIMMKHKTEKVQYISIYSFVNANLNLNT